VVAAAPFRGIHAAAQRLSANNRRQDRGGMVGHLQTAGRYAASPLRAEAHAEPNCLGLCGGVAERLAGGRGGNM
jgi:hypothetical protein